ncbi:hypothetical protein [Comamonas thiooxydans]|uniref:crAss001_48 related protein n=1 Tax=Comamonas thiooxydans TaxID=363952 RepID=UPI000A66A7A8|nr:hypothetical protein [Comamonas thiooxydans]
MRRDANAGNWVKACRENVRWNKGRVHGMSTVLPDLKIRGDANTELCEWGCHGQLDSEEQARMRRQLDVMRELSVILGERIASF